MPTRGSEATRAETRKRILFLVGLKHTSNTDLRSSQFLFDDEKKLHVLSRGNMSIIDRILITHCVDTLICFHFDNVSYYSYESNCVCKYTPDIWHLWGT